MLTAVRAIGESGQIPAKAQQGSGSYYSFPSEVELDAFLKQGWRLYDPEDITTLARRFLPGR